MRAALGHALGQERSAPGEIHETHVRCAHGAQQVTIAPLERRARDGETSPCALRFLQSGRYREQPVAAVGVRQRRPGCHALHVLRGMQVITFDERDVELASQLRADQTLSGAGDAHDHVKAGMDSAHEVAPILYHRGIRGYCAGCMTQIAFAGVGVDFGDTTVFSNVSFTVAPGERWGIVGRNGSGKTTLFRLLMGELAPTRGIVAWLRGAESDPRRPATPRLPGWAGGGLGPLGLARQLRTPADVLLLDEPTNHLDLETTRWLEEYLAASGRTVLLVSHDRTFLAATVDRVLHLEGKTATPYTGGYAAFVTQRAERRLAQQRAYDQQQRTIAHEKDYIARNIAGQNSRQAKGRRKRLDRLPRLSPVIGAEGTMAVRFDVPERGGDQVVSAKNVSVGIGTRTLVERFSGTLERTGVLGIIGRNGSGKSTLLRALVGEHPIEAGELRLGTSITAGYYRQDLSQVPLDRTLYDVIAALRPKWERRRIQGHLGRFGFSGQEVQRRADSLSGGERARVALAILMLSGANLLVLDEPTNHLDVESIEALEDAVQAYDGTVILVSHDRALLRALTTRMWILHERRMTEFAGGFAEWEEVSTERAHAAAVSAAEEQALRQVHEHQRVAPPTKKDPRKELRRAQQELEEAEARGAEPEAPGAKVVAALEDPALYTRPDGTRAAHELGTQLETLKRDLEAGLERWTQATEQVEMRAPR